MVGIAAVFKLEFFHDLSSRSLVLLMIISSVSPLESSTLLTKRDTLFCSLRFSQTVSASSFCRIGKLHRLGLALKGGNGVAVALICVNKVALARNGGIIIEKICCRPTDRRRRFLKSTACIQRGVFRSHRNSRRKFVGYSLARRARIRG